jgi:hypothetical protein
MNRPRKTKPKMIRMTMMTMIQYSIFLPLHGSER